MATSAMLNGEAGVSDASVVLELLAATAESGDANPTKSLQASTPPSEVCRITESLMKMKKKKGQQVGILRVYKLERMGV